MLNAGQRPNLNNLLNSNISKDPVSLIKINKQTNTHHLQDKDNTQKKSKVDIYSYNDDIIQENEKKKPFIDPYIELDPPIEIYCQDNQSTNRYLTPSQFQWWGIKYNQQLINYHNEMRRKENEEKTSRLKSQNEQRLKSSTSDNHNKNDSGDRNTNNMKKNINISTNNSNKNGLTDKGLFK